MSIELTVNGNPVSVSTADNTPLLDVLRNHLDLKGSRYGPKGLALRHVKRGYCCAVVVSA